MLDIASASELPHVRIRAGEPGPLIDVPELLRFRDPLWILAERDLRVRYKQTALGVTRSWFACRAAWRPAVGEAGPQA